MSEVFPSPELSEAEVRLYKGLGEFWLRQNQQGRLMLEENYEECEPVLIESLVNDGVSIERAKELARLSFLEAEMERPNE